MKPLAYHRPKSLEQALSLLPGKAPLAGGTRLVPQRARLDGVVDLQDLDLVEIRIEAGRFTLGAGVRLQSLVDAGDQLPEPLVQACLLEAGQNLRNMASLAGTVLTADGRSPLAAVLLAFGARAVLEPGGVELEIGELLGRPAGWTGSRLIVRFVVRRPVWSAYEQVARSPADRPLVCAAACGEQDGGVRLALGGFGPRPILIRDAGAEPGAAAAEAYRQAGDLWASAEYRSEVAGILARRVVGRGAER